MASKSVISALEEVLAAVDEDAGQVPDVTTFIVGGRKFQILEQTIRLRGQTMLSDLLDDPHRSDRSSPIYVEGDGMRFRYILDWYRFGSLKLPFGVGVEEVRRDCAFYGLPDDVSILHEGMGDALGAIIAKKRAISEDFLSVRIRAAAHAALEMMIRDPAFLDSGTTSRVYNSGQVPQATDLNACMVWQALMYGNQKMQRDMFKGELTGLASANGFTVTVADCGAGGNMKVTLSLATEVHLINK